jgi:Family of unknown function (DUF6459)
MPSNGIKRDTGVSMTMPLRARPIPVVEPRPALRVVQDDDPVPAPWPSQDVLPLELEAALVVPPPQREPGLLRGWALRFTQVALEVVAGLRPPGQLVRLTSEEVQAGLQRRHALALRADAVPRRFRVRSVHVSTPLDGIAEVAAVVGEGGRYRAVAFRMEGHGERWEVTALDMD